MDGLRLNFLRKHDLALAIRERLHVPDRQAEEWAEDVTSIFGFEQQVIDNRLEPDDRQLFYRLQEAGLVTTSGEETVLHTGQTWRTHYWMPRFEEIERAAAEAGATRDRLDQEREAQEEAEAAKAEDPYAELPEDAWARAPH